VYNAATANPLDINNERKRNHFPHVLRPPHNYRMTYTSPGKAAKSLETIDITYKVAASTASVVSAIDRTGTHEHGTKDEARQTGMRA
jgi:hypothetical protein